MAERTSLSVLLETRDAMDESRRQLQVAVGRSISQGETVASALRVSALHFDEWVALLKEGRDG